MARRLLLQIVKTPQMKQKVKRKSKKKKLNTKTTTKRKEKEEQKKILKEKHLRKVTYMLFLSFKVKLTKLERMTFEEPIKNSR